MLPSNVWRRRPSTTCANEWWARLARCCDGKNYPGGDRWDLSGFRMFVMEEAS